MIRKIVKIDENKCDGCGICISACHEGALEIVGGKAQLVSETYCDGLGSCLTCPQNAITIEERVAEEFDAVAVANRMQNAVSQSPHKGNLAQSDTPKVKEEAGCAGPGSKARIFNKKLDEIDVNFAHSPQSQLRQWPCQIELVPIHAPYFDGADMLIAADCSAFAFADMHRTLMRDKITLIGCPKLDTVDYAEKLSAILAQNAIRSISVVRMEVPCCGGLVVSVKKAIADSGKKISGELIIISTEGEILRQEKI